MKKNCKKITNRVRKTNTAAAILLASRLSNPGTPWRD